MLPKKPLPFLRPHAILPRPAGRRVSGARQVNASHQPKRGKETQDAAVPDATDSRRGPQRRLRRGRLQRQQHGTDPGHHEGRPGYAIAPHHPGQPRGTGVHQPHLPQAPDDGRRRRQPQPAHRPAPRPRAQPRPLQAGRRTGLHERHDRRVHRLRGQDARRQAPGAQPRRQHPRHQGGRRLRPLARRQRRGRTGDTRRHRRRHQDRPGPAHRPRRGPAVLRAHRRRRPRPGHRHPSRSSPWTSSASAAGASPTPPS